MTSAGNGVWSDTGGSTVEQDLVIGTTEGDPEYQFGQIAGKTGRCGCLASINPLLFHGDAIYGVLRDDLDVQHVARMSLQRGELRG